MELDGLSEFVWVTWDHLSEHSNLFDDAKLSKLWGSAFVGSPCTI